ncbi:Na+/H+ antiporter NhaC [Virgibacillus siamensis]|uniref:Na+/H+ antiporter NhaC n=1 Tax=Virgibacillus siamensis TaxID=480071 RepID=UPI0009857B48|nr:Na+/H+ antiporter NhaC [Virgibacillus siamensis]
MEDSRKQISLVLSIIPFIVMIVAMSFTILVFHGAPHIPLILGAMVAAFIAWKSGYKWKEIENFIYNGIYKVLPAVIILIAVGMIISSWIGSGIVATMIFYGLKIISPSLFLVTIMIICSIVSIMIGSSWSTMGTVGIAGMGIGISMGFPPAMVAGAVISGAYFGDKMSPLSDTTVLASSMAETDLFQHIRHMTYTTVPATIIALIIYWFMGLNYAGGTIQSGNIQAVIKELQANFLISPWLLLIPLIVILLIVKKVPALPALAAGIILGFLAEVFVQGANVSDAVVALQDGYHIDSGNDTVDSLLNQGGISSMMYTVSLAMVAMIFGGIMEGAGMLKVIVNQILKIVKKDGSLLGVTVLSSFMTNVITAEQYISIVIPGRMYSKTYRDRNLHPKNLSRALEDGGTVTAPLLPWTTGGVFILSTLGVGALQYAPYAIMNLATPIISIIISFLGIGIVYTNKNGETDKEVKRQDEHETSKLYD